VTLGVSSKAVQHIKQFLVITEAKVHALFSMVTSAKDFILCNNGNQTMLINPNPLLSKAEWCRYLISLTTSTF
jgi:hypothetical protein